MKANEPQEQPGLVEETRESVKDFDEQRDAAGTLMDPNFARKPSEFYMDPKLEKIAESSSPDSDELSLVYGNKGLFKFLRIFNEIKEKDKHKINYLFALRDPIDDLLFCKSKEEVPKICSSSGPFRKYEHVCSNNMIKIEAS